MRRVLPLLAGTFAAAAAWVFLVRAAIEFGQAAGNSGRGVSDWAISDWTITIGAGAGAALCLLLVLVLVARLRDALGVTRGDRPHGEHRRR